MTLKPIYIDPATGMAGFGPEDFQKVISGYACAQCWEEFPCYTFKCPVCGLERDLERDVKETPRHWLPSPEEENVREYRENAADEALAFLRRKHS